MRWLLLLSLCGCTLDVASPQVTVHCFELIYGSDHLLYCADAGAPPPAKEASAPKADASGSVTTASGGIDQSECPGSLDKSCGMVGVPPKQSIELPELP